MHPIGLIDTSVGSTRIECWMDKQSLSICKPIYDALNPLGGDKGPQQRLGGCSHRQKGGLDSTFFNGVRAVGTAARSRSTARSACSLTQLVHTACSQS